MTPRASLIDHTLLTPTASREAVTTLCREAAELGMASVCVNPVHVPLAARLLADAPVAVCTVIDFPLGASSTVSKAEQARLAVADGATEVDMVIALGAVKEHDWDYVEQDVRAVVEAAGPAATVKVILETCLLDDEEVTRACLCAEAAGAGFVKTSTGFSTGGASVHAVGLMHAAVGGRLGVKASGGIHTPQELDALVAAGATRIGASAGRALLGEEARA
ncbi:MULTISPECIES: deoxyribose-phosphate aldolase [unclassified Actinomyces]|uniref:deoxyribose-phosphate aldolase n=1 Tax=unclassified Actinomyces TaxID=2609248 RepID=UPI002017470B|nr:MULTISPECIES: deoxyribose-phosphate aldolase [unclassified Actinomyces]MCL3777224.1 deoxyribose-phosphate aldolase [Actinomyces sp. AC-20-1]MCL3789299.1 deoxyribose-phosphate aldolase [Actinomyces sp. 187325]MCL3791719.1 deoxyribose-phosphate aldolase [Actinomyces sp. 186855]MCL3794241.1 deoxyribose-phosphate aldolase [Actinomyces sp. 217892]